MHFLILTSTYFPSTNGVASNILLQKKALESLGHKVTIFTPSHPHQVKEAGVYRHLSLPNPLSPDYPIPIPLPPFEFIRCLFRNHFDVILLHHPFVTAFLSQKISQIKKIPQIFFYHSRYDLIAQNYASSIRLTPLQDFIISRINSSVKKTVSNADLVIAETTTLKNFINHKYPNIRTQVLTTPPKSMLLSDITKQQLRKRYHLPQNKVILLNVSRLTPEKNLETLLHIVSKCSQLPHLHLCLVGCGSSKKQLISLARKLGIVNQVTFLGSFPFSQMPEIYSLADILASTSLTETQGYTTLEAMTAKLPVIAIRAPGTQDFVQDSKTGFLVTSPNSFIQKIDLLVKNVALRNRLGKSAKEASENFSFIKWAKTLVKISSNLTILGT